MKAILQDGWDDRSNTGVSAK